MFIVSGVTPGYFLPVARFVTSAPAGFDPSLNTIRSGNGGSTATAASGAGGGVTALASGGATVRGEPSVPVPAMIADPSLPEPVPLPPLLLLRAKNAAAPPPPSTTIAPRISGNFDFARGLSSSWGTWRFPVHCVR